MGCDVRLLDAFHAAPRQRERDAVFSRDGQALSRWRYGLRAPELRRRFRAMVAEGWLPDDIVITTLTSFWWHGAAFVQNVARSIFPDARLILGGAYPTAAPAHAMAYSGADLVLPGSLPDSVLRCIPAYSLAGGRRLARLAPHLPWPPHIWAGVSIETNRYRWRAKHLRAVPASVRFISAEPLLGSLDDLDLTGIHWLIVGGESGPHYRSCDPAWVRSLRDRALEAGIPFFFKQWGGRTPKAGGRLLDGKKRTALRPLPREVRSPFALLQKVQAHA